MSQSLETMQAYAASINSQYGQPNLAAELLAALQRIGKDPAALARDDIAPFEEIHLRGREATRDLAHLVGLREDMLVLDVGCGVGGPARTLAAEFDCQVTGIDVTENYIRAAALLTERVGLSHRVTIRQGNALDMPFDEASFDIVWMQHVAMNIEDKACLFSEVRRVLRPGGRLAFHEIFSGPVAPPHFPVPWANHPAFSFLVTPDAFRRALGEAELDELAWVDDTARCKEIFRAQSAARTPGSPPPIGYDLVLGANFPEKRRNVKRNLEENRIVVFQGVYATGGRRWDPVRFATKKALAAASE